MLNLIVPLQHRILHQSSIRLADDSYSSLVKIIIVPYPILISISPFYLQWLFLIEPFTVPSIRSEGIIYKSRSRIIKEVKCNAIGEYYVETIKWSCGAFEGCEVVDGNLKWQRSVDCWIDYWTSINSYSYEIKLWGVVPLLLQSQPNCGTYKVNRPLKNSLNKQQYKMRYYLYYLINWFID